MIVCFTLQCNIDLTCVIYVLYYQTFSSDKSLIRIIRVSSAEWWHSVLKEVGVIKRHWETRKIECGRTYVFYLLTVWLSLALFIVILHAKKLICIRLFKYIFPYEQYSYIQNYEIYFSSIYSNSIYIIINNILLIIKFFQDIVRKYIILININSFNSLIL